MAQEAACLGLVGWWPGEGKFSSRSESDWWKFPEGLDCCCCVGLSTSSAEPAGAGRRPSVRVRQCAVSGWVGSGWVR